MTVAMHGGGNNHALGCACPWCASQAKGQATTAPFPGTVSDDLAAAVDAPEAAPQVGDRVYWTDPDDGLGSRWGTVTSASEGILDDGIVVLDHDTEVLPEEISKAPEGPMLTPAFADEDGDHAPQEWGSFDADDRYPGEFTEHAGQRDGFRMSVTPGDANSFAAPGYSWRAEPSAGASGPFFSGQADTLEQAQRDAVSSVDYCTSGRYEHDMWRAQDLENAQRDARYVIDEWSHPGLKSEQFFADTHQSAHKLVAAVEGTAEGDHHAYEIRAALAHLDYRDEMGADEKEQAYDRLFNAMRATFDEG